MTSRPRSTTPATPTSGTTCLPTLTCSTAAGASTCGPATAAISTTLSSATSMLAPSRTTCSCGTRTATAFPSTIRAYGRRGIASYNEDVARPYNAGDLIATQAAAYDAYAAMLELMNGAEASAAGAWRAKAQALRTKYDAEWWCAAELAFRRPAPPQPELRVQLLRHCQLLSAIFEPDRGQGEGRTCPGRGDTPPPAALHRGTQLSARAVLRLWPPIGRPRRVDGAA